MKHDKNTLGGATITELDYLTGLANRRSLYDYFSQLSPETVLHAMYLDIDNFKSVNDVYGHSMGDKLLIAVSKLIQTHAKGFTSRIGGDEYVVLLDGNLNQESVESIAHNLLSNVSHLDFRKDILSLISLSIGIVMDQRL
ncbi:MAG: GGDEF domain-containing protein, partial [Eubacterium sp.]|nr:GGDEF domain-containing protein [Eubacterium sp.]